LGTGGKGHAWLCNAGEVVEETWGGVGVLKIAFIDPYLFLIACFRNGNQTSAETRTTC
jgi:hypothetical protein